MRKTDADALKQDLRESYEELEKIYDGLKRPNDKAICGGQLATFLECIMRVRNAPTIEAEPVKHGRWVLGEVEPGYFTPGGNRPWVCSECDYLASWMLDSPTYNYCPNCGAKMQGGADHERS